MITVHWFVLFALAVSALISALFGFWAEQRSAKAYQAGYSQGAQDQMASSNKRLEAEIEIAATQGFQDGWDMCARLGKADSERSAT